MLVTVPVPAEYEIESAEVESLIEAALSAAETQGVSGKKLTPFLLNELSQKSGGKTLAANVALLENNARVAAEIAVALNF
jgi:pseudouridine-5'-phosphate glycosidase